MTNKFNDSLIKLKGGFLSVYPNINDVLHALSIMQVPWFDLKFEDGRRQALALVSVHNAVHGLHCADLVSSIQNFHQKKHSSRPKSVFQALMPIIKTWLDSGNYLSCSRTLSAFFMKLDDEGDANFFSLISDIEFQLENEFDTTENTNEKKSLADSISKLQSLKEFSKNEQVLIAPDNLSLSLALNRQKLIEKLNLAKTLLQQIVAKEDNILEVPVKNQLNKILKIISEIVAQKDMSVNAISDMSKAAMILLDCFDPRIHSWSWDRANAIAEIFEQVINADFAVDDCALELSADILNHSNNFVNSNLINEPSVEESTGAHEKITNNIASFHLGKDKYEDEVDSVIYYTSLLNSWILEHKNINLNENDVTSISLRMAHKMGIQLSLNIIDKIEMEAAEMQPNGHDEKWLKSQRSEENFDQSAEEVLMALGLYKYL
jgi:hypothetical protein